MNKIIGFLRGSARHPKTTAAGMAAIAGALFGVIAEPAILRDPTVWVTIVTGVGLLLAGDGRDDEPPPGVPSGDASAGDPRRNVTEIRRPEPTPARLPYWRLRAA